MVVSMLSGISWLLAQAPTTQELADKLTLDSQILSSSSTTSPSRSCG
jgi:hypothetical protein